MSHEIAELAHHVRSAKSVLVVTGAGVSADSGLPTYRGIGGLYVDADTDDGVPIEEALSGDMLRRRPEVCWKHIAQIEAACRGAKPNDAHHAIARFEARLERAWVLTQNVDGLHRAAGSNNLMEIHGNVGRLLCTRCEWRAEVPDYAALTIPPACPRCTSLVRPDVVLFGETLPAPVTRRLYTELARGFDLVLSVGTTSVFPYIAAPVIDAVRRGRPAVEINPGESEVSAIATLRIRRGAAETFRLLERELDGD